ncbi:MAG: extracellular solute-binding protein [Clostridia bacterium]|nr:extracellular solute-binding protein [Clostridia bacterium]
MNAKVIKVASLFLAIAMMACLFAACGKKQEASGSIYVCGNCGYEATEQFTNCPECQTEAPDTTPEDGNNATDGGDTSSKLSAGQQGGGKDEGKDEGGKKGKYTFAADPYSDIPASVKGSTVDVLLWRDAQKVDTALVEAFEKKTGIKVNLITTPNNSAAYATKLASLISSGDAPDVVNLGASNFPAWAITSLEPIDEEMFRLDDKFWNKNIMDQYKINGNYYGVSTAGSWYCDDTSYVTYYYPEKLKGMGITTMPYDLYKAGKWNTDAVASIARKVHEKGNTYKGVSIQTNTISNPYMLAAGADFVKYNGKEYTSNLSNSTVLKYQQMLAQWYQDGLVTGWDSTGLQNGTVGLFDAISYGMYIDAKWFTVVSDPSVIDCVPVAGNATPSNAKLWGVGKGANNVEAGVYFIRFFIDPKSFDYTSFKSMKGTFEDDQMYAVWQDITSANKKHVENMAIGCLTYYDTSAYGNLTSKLSATTAANIKTVLDEYGATMKAACNKANKYLGRAQKKPSYVK